MNQNSKGSCNQDEYKYKYHIKYLFHALHFYYFIWHVCHLGHVALGVLLNIWLNVINIEPLTPIKKKLMLNKLFIYTDQIAVIYIGTTTATFLLLNNLALQFVF